jgi:hypothetical protein
MLSMLRLGHGWLAGWLAGGSLIIIYYPILKSFFDQKCLRPVASCPLEFHTPNSSPSCSKSPTPGSVLHGHKELDYLPARPPANRAVTHFNRAEVPPCAASISGPALP